MSGSTVISPPPESAVEAPRPARSRRWATTLLTAGCRWVLAVVFLAAALSKIADLGAFSDRVVLHSGLPPALAAAGAAFLPWLELTCGMCLALGVMQREAALLLALLLLFFLGHALARPAQPDCGCFLFPGLTAQTTPLWQQVVRNLVLLGSTVWLCRAPAADTR
jgi:putative oxidoreductase